MSDTTYTVSLVKGFPYPQRVRSGITTTQTVPYEGPLTKEQLEAIEADAYLELEVIKPVVAPTTKAKTQTSSK